MPPTSKQPFRGFQRPNYTMVPDELFDELLPDLTGAELKVLLYIIRRTFGFKKDSDNISLSQMMRGITTHDGRVLDRGAGLTKKTVLQALRSLEEQHIIISQRRQSEEKGNEPTSYRLNIIGVSPNGYPLGGISTPPLGEKVRQGGSGESTPSLRVGNAPSPRGKNFPSQETVEQETDRQHSNIRRAPNDEGQSFGSTSRAEDVIGEADEREVIEAFIRDFAREFNDRAPLRSSVSRALNLYQRSGVDRPAFFKAMYEARARVRTHAASIQARDEPGASGAGMKRKMAYFFAVLEALLGLREQA